MRNVQVSVDVFQAIWAARQPGEDDEDTILSRLLGVGGVQAIPKTAGVKPWIDRQYGVTFDHGFEMFRRRKGKEFRARVIDANWHINGQPVDAKSINEVSKAVGAEGENGWVGWNFRSSSGEAKKISDLRDPDQIIRRSSSQFSKEVSDALDFKL